MVTPALGRGRKWPAGSGDGHMACNNGNALIFIELVECFGPRSHRHLARTHLTRAHLTRTHLSHRRAEPSGSEGDIRAFKQLKSKIGVSEGYLSVAFQQRGEN